MKTQTFNPITRARLQQLSYPRLLWAWLQIKVLKVRYSKQARAMRAHWLLRRFYIRRLVELLGVICAGVACALVIVFAGIGLATVAHVLTR